MLLAPEERGREEVQEGSLEEMTPEISFKGRVGFAEASLRRYPLTLAGFYRAKEGKHILSRKNGL